MGLDNVEWGHFCPQLFTVASETILVHPHIFQRLSWFHLWQRRKDIQICVRLCLFHLYQFKLLQFQMVKGHPNFLKLLQFHLCWWTKDVRISLDLGNSMFAKRQRTSRFLQTFAIPSLPKGQRPSRYSKLLQFHQSTSRFLETFAIPSFPKEKVRPDFFRLSRFHLFQRRKDIWSLPPQLLLWPAKLHHTWIKLFQVCSSTMILIV